MAGGSPTPLKLPWSQTRMGNIQWICLDQQEFHSYGYRYSWWMVSCAFPDVISLCTYCHCQLCFAHHWILISIFAWPVIFLVSLGWCSCMWFTCGVLGFQYKGKINNPCKINIYWLVNTSIFRDSFQWVDLRSCLFYRLVDIASHYYDLENFPQCEAKRVLEKLYKKREKEKDQKKNRKIEYNKLITSWNWQWHWMIDTDYSWDARLASNISKESWPERLLSSIIIIFDRSYLLDSYIQPTPPMHLKLVPLVWAYTYILAF